MSRAGFTVRRADPVPDPDDASCVALVLGGDPNAFRAIVERYQSRLYNLCLRLLGRRQDAEDAAQEAFLRAYDALARYDPSRPLAAWLVEIAVNICRDKRRAAWWQRVFLGDGPVRDAPDPSDGPERRLNRAESLKALVTAMQSLRPADREALAVSIEELPPAEAARSLGISTNALYVRQNRARARLAALLRQRHPELFSSGDDGGSR